MPKKIAASIFSLTERLISTVDKIEPKLTIADYSSVIDTVEKMCNDHNGISDIMLRSQSLGLQSTPFCLYESDLRLIADKAKENTSEAWNHGTTFGFKTNVEFCMARNIIQFLGFKISKMGDSEIEHEAVSDYPFERFNSLKKQKPLNNVQAPIPLIFHEWDMVFMNSEACETVEDSERFTDLSEDYIGGTSFVVEYDDHYFINKILLALGYKTETDDADEWIDEQGDKHFDLFIYSNYPWSRYQELLKKAHFEYFNWENYKNYTLSPDDTIISISPSPVYLFVGEKDALEICGSMFQNSTLDKNFFTKSESGLYGMGFVDGTIWQHTNSMEYLILRFTLKHLGYSFNEITLEGDNNPVNYLVSNYPWKRLTTNLHPEEIN